MKQTPMKKTPIWILLDSRNPGGIESHVFQLARGLHTRNENVTVVFFADYGDHPLKTGLQQHGINTICLDGHMITLWKAIRKARPWILHTHGYKAGISGRIMAVLYNIPVVSTYHAGEISSGKLKMYDWLDRKTACLASRVFAVSSQIAQRLPVNARVVDNFVDSNMTVLNGKQIAFTGRLSMEKGPDYFLKLASRFPEYLFHVYGDGPLATKLKIAAPGNIRFHGQQNDMTRVWPDIALLVMPSRHEGLPMAALEAMAQGIPVLAFRVGALDQLVDTGSNGWLVAPGNNNKLADCLRLWTGMNEQQKRLFRQAARQKILQRFSADIAIPQLVACYRQIAS